MVKVGKNKCQKKTNKIENKYQQGRFKSNYTQNTANDSELTH